jgi:hypothetical protein
MLVAGFAVFIALFSALTPALAAWRFSDRPEILAELCTPAGIERVAIDDAPDRPQPAPRPHGVYCVLCLPAAQYALTHAAAPSAGAASGVTEPPPATATTPYASRFPADYQSRAPPALLN